MNALKNRQKRSKREREKDLLTSQTVIDSLELFIHTFALTLNEMDGYGEKRITDRMTDALKRIDEYTERYGSDCVLTAMKNRLKDIGITIEIEGK